MKMLKARFKSEGLDPTKVNKEEGFFYDWLLELKRRGYVKKIDVQHTIQLIDPVKLPFIRRSIKQYKAGPRAVEKETSFTALNGLSYTPDFRVEWTSKALGRFIFTEGDVVDNNFTELCKRMFYYQVTDDEYVTFIEIKGTFAARHNSTNIKFPLLQKLTYKLTGKFVQKVMPFHIEKGLFANTFTPKSYLKTPTGKDRVVGWTVMDIKGYEQILIEHEEKKHSLSE